MNRENFENPGTGITRAAGTGEKQLELEEMRRALDDASCALTDLKSGIDKMESGKGLAEVARASVTVDEAITDMEFQVGRLRTEYEGLKPGYLFGGGKGGTL